MNLKPYKDIELSEEKARKYLFMTKENKINFRSVLKGNIRWINAFLKCKTNYLILTQLLHLCILSRHPNCIYIAIIMVYTELHISLFSHILSLKYTLIFLQYYFNDFIIILSMSAMLYCIYSIRTYFRNISRKVKTFCKNFIIFISVYQFKICKTFNITAITIL